MSNDFLTDPLFRIGMELMSLIFAIAILCVPAFKKQNRGTVVKGGTDN